MILDFFGIAIMGAVLPDYESLSKKENTIEIKEMVEKAAVRAPAI